MRRYSAEPRARKGSGVRAGELGRRAPEPGAPVVNAANQRADQAARRAQAREQFVEIGIAVMSEPNLPALAEIRELRQENERLQQLVAKLNLMLKA